MLLHPVALVADRHGPGSGHPWSPDPLVLALDSSIHTDPIPQGTNHSLPPSELRYSVNSEQSRAVEYALTINHPRPLSSPPSPIVCSPALSSIVLPCSLPLQRISARNVV
ncbi:hypothetical protein G7Z17_g6631 [Cylindrodendrum hubeiense]|uniref:Uncharacterized protein n=1 Tax=Cylindrodendrum hubeiense TaxID=595255 RepID=A0A9P5LGK8_9HYPO|nr:hypothetical protein G7Z17_g6631 [Cylindrodendrum hubeiense]